MLSEEQAMQAAKDLSEYCSNQFCPNCIFNQGSCKIGTVGCVPKLWDVNEHDPVIPLDT